MCLPLAPPPWPFVAYSATHLTPPGPYPLVVSMCVPSRPRDEVAALLSFGAVAGDISQAPDLS